jgi:broad specificity phosphatase PhoE/8-oxo-dGTP pyrophosphatase MutT (NUDIX family)
MRAGVIGEPHAQRCRFHGPDSGRIGTGIGRRESDAMVDDVGRCPPGTPARSLMRLVRAAGGVVLRRIGGRLEVVLVHRPAYDDWSFPKGKLEPGEDELHAALREVQEEAGLPAQPKDDLGAVRYVDGHGRPKEVRYWTMTVAPGTEPTAENEVDVARWVAVEDAEHQLTYLHDRHLLARAIGAEVPSTAVSQYVVRHGKAGDRDRWQGPDELRGLSKSGRRQAEQLVHLFDGVAVARLFSSPFVRCVQTLEPLAEARGLDIELAPELEEGASASAAEALIIAAAADGPSAFSTHGDVMKNLVQDVLARGVPLRGPQSIGFGKGSVWLLDVVDGTVAAASYVPLRDDSSVG